MFFYKKYITLKFPALTYFIIICTLLYGCKPKQRQSESNDHIRVAMSAKSMGESNWKQYSEQFSDIDRQKFSFLLKKYEHTTGIVEYDDYLLGKKIHVAATLENGILHTQIGHFENGVLALEYYNVHNDVIVDSVRCYYPDAKLYSRKVLLVDSTQELYEEYHASGKIRSRSLSNQLFTWHANGNQSGLFVFDQGQVIQRTLWYMNGKKKEESRWWNDTLVGPYKEWDSLGNQTRNVFFVNGKIKK